MALDYNVSDRIRFITNFALTYTNNDKNYEARSMACCWPSPRTWHPT